MKILKYITNKNQINPAINYTGITKYMPIILCGGFFLLTIILFAFGPFQWGINNQFSLYTFLILSFLSLVAGYIVGTNIKLKKTQSNFDINKIIFVSFIIFIIMYVLNTYATTGKFFPDIIHGILNSGDAYGASHTINSGIATFIIYLGIIIAPLTSVITPLYYIYYNNLSLTSKILGTIVLILNLFIGISQGVINAFAIIAFQVVMFLIIYFFSDIKNNILKRSIKFFIIFVSIIFCFLLYYKTIMGNRLVSDAQKPSDTPIENKEEIKEESKKENNYNNGKDSNNESNNKNIEDKKNESIDKITNNMFDVSAELISQAPLKEKHLYSFLPNSIESSLNHIISYLTHGYKGLSLVIDREFTSSYGLGFSDFFRHNLLKVIGKTNIEESIYQRTYMYKLDQSGWITGSVWVTFFVYPASDIGFPLTLVLVFFIGLVFSLSWKDALQSKNIFAAAVFLHLCMIICFFSANNVHLQNGGPFLTFATMCICWIISKKVGKKV